VRATGHPAAACERLIQTIQTGFESTLRMAGNQAKSLEHLNGKFAGWIQTIYHLRAHGSTGVSPEARYQQAAQTLRHWDPSLDIEPLFYLRINRTVRKNGTVHLDNDLYEVPLSLRTLEVQLRLDPWRRQRIEVWYQDKFMGLARKAPLHLNSQISFPHDH
jgi:putative transposase